jgi:hypothetical protein
VFYGQNHLADNINGNKPAQGNNLVVYAENWFKQAKSILKGQP